MWKRSDVVAYSDATLRSAVIIGGALTVTNLGLAERSEDTGRTCWASFGKRAETLYQSLPSSSPPAGV
jgi:hypothetical protein